MERHAPSPTPIPDMINAIIDIFFTEIPLNFAQIGFPPWNFYILPTLVKENTSIHTKKNAANTNILNCVVFSLLTAIIGTLISEPVPFILIRTSTSAFNTLSIAIVVTKTGRLKIDASTELNSPIKTATPRQAANIITRLSVLL